MFGQTDRWAFGTMTLEKFSEGRNLFATLGKLAGRARAGRALPQGWV